MQGINHTSVSRWIIDHVPGTEGPLEFTPIAGGKSSLTFLVADRNGEKLVLRRPPLGRTLDSAHNMAREFRVISAVNKSVVPLPQALALCEDPGVNGAPFYLVRFVEGVVLDSEAAARSLDPRVKPLLSENLIDALVKLQDIDIDAVGLGDLARRENFIRRQLKRWSAQWANSKTRELPVIDEVAALLQRNVPEQQGVCLVHGDYRFGNCLVNPNTGEIAAVLDWELCTIGDPLADIGYLAVWSGDIRTSAARNDPTSFGGFPGYRDMLRLYAQKSGRDVADIDYYIALGLWRLAVIAEGVYGRFLHGEMGEQAETDLDLIKHGVASLAEQAVSLLRKRG